MVLFIPNSFLLCLPILAVFLVGCIWSFYNYKEMSSGGAEAGMIGAAMCIFAPFIATLMFAIPYGMGLIIFYVIKG